MSKLTPRQADMLEAALSPSFEHGGYPLFGGMEFRTARTLERRKLGRVDQEGRFTAFEAGRAALQHKDESHDA